MSATPSAFTFQHTPLPDRNWIRLITIDPVLMDGNIACTLHLFDGDSRPEYVALSYLWGDPAPKHTININGMIRKIHENLWQFLHWAWRNKETEYLWIDSICLNQEKHSELNEQVQGMGDIYHQAHHVLSWLGESPLDIEAVQILVNFGHGELAPDFIDRIRKALSRFEFEMTYWGRVWIFQEVICAKECSVVCGPVEIEFEELVRRSFFASMCCALNDFHRKMGIKKLATLRTSLKCEQRLKITTLVATLSSCESTREVDRIYGLLGLSSRLDPDFDSQALEVDYSKSLNQVFWDVACLSTETIQGPRDSEVGIGVDCTEYLNFLASMPIIKDRKSTCTLTELALAIGADLEVYSTATATPEKWRRRVRVALQIYQAITSTWEAQHGHRTINIWKSAVKGALRQQIYRRDGVRDVSEGIILGLSLLTCALDHTTAYRKWSSSISPSSSRWLCAAHMRTNKVVKGDRVISLSTPEFLDGPTDVRMTCAVNSQTCNLSTLSCTADEGLVLELTRPRNLTWQLDPEYDEAVIEFMELDRPDPDESHN